ncbi:MAG: PRK06851 family protein [Dethiobacteria bacterium]|jgi:hypothetical protein
MVIKGRLKKVFPGSNSAYGFYSFYDQIIEDNATRTFVIKGGPGVGKSTFMRNIGKQLLNKGLDVEYHYCSSDNDSLDGIVVPQLRVACIDGTAPHLIDPKHPGAVDEIIHLGDYWDEQGVRAQKDEIIWANQEIARLFRRVYSFLKAAKLFLDEVEGYYRENNALEEAGLDKLALDLIQEIFKGKTQKVLYNRRERHLFATAITPDGPVSHLGTLIEDIKTRYIVSGDDGTGKNQLIARIKDAAVMHGYFVEVYHCALDPVKIDHIVIPSLGVAVLNSVSPHVIHAKSDDIEIHTEEYVRDLGKTLLKERNIARQMHEEAFSIAFEYLRQAKRVHDQLESYYIPNMRFSEISSLCDQVTKKILDFAEKQGLIKE